MSSTYYNKNGIHSAEFFGLDISSGIISITKPMWATVDLRHPALWFFDKDKANHTLGQLTKWNGNLHKLFLFGLANSHSWLLDTATTRGLLTPLAIGIEGGGEILKTSDLPVLLVALNGYKDVGGTLEILAKLPDNSKCRFTLILNNDGLKQAILN